MIHYYFKDKLINDFFYKDVFCVPLELGRQLGEDVELNFIGSDFDLENPYKNNKHVKINIHKNYLSMFFYFFKNIKNITLLGLFHVYKHSIIFSFFYKLLNKKGKIYIKGDFNQSSLENLYFLYKKYMKFINYILNIFDIISFENDESFNYFKDFVDIEKLKTKLLIVKNAPYIDKETIGFDINKKDNIILIIGRIYYEKAKNYSFLLKVFNDLSYKLYNWKIIFIGETKGKFDGEYIDFLKENFSILKSLENSGVDINFLGKIQDRRTIYTYLNQSKIFCLSSNFEGDPLVQYEAMYYGNYMVSTDVGTIKDNYYKNFISLSEVGDFNRYKSNLESIIDFFEKEDIKKIKKLQNKTHEYCKNNYSWNSNLEEVINLLNTK